MHGIALLDTYHHNVINSSYAKDGAVDEPTRTEVFHDDHSGA